MYTAIISGILLREYPITPVGVGAVAIVVLLMLKFRNKVAPTTNSFMIRWISMIVLVEIGTFLTLAFLVEIVWNVFQLKYNLLAYDSLMSFYMLSVSGIYIGTVYHDEYNRLRSFGLSESSERVIKDVPCNYTLELYESYELKDHFAFKWIRRLAIHSIYPIASFLIYIAVTYKQAPKVGYGIVGVLSVITFIFIFKVVLEGRVVDRSRREDTQPSIEQK
jgi:membrane protein